MKLLQSSTRYHYAVLVAILVLSAYVHLWNPVGYPDIFFDEGIYMRRAMTVLETGSPQESAFYDHPYFGQMFLSGFLKVVGFPQTVEQSLEMSYLVPRVLMGLLAVLDTFLIYKITEKRFGRHVAVLAAVLFAAMPMTWMLRRILLDGILLPFMLSSILLALHSRDSENKSVMILGSSVLLGLAIFTKLTAITMIPVVGYIIASNHGIRALSKWLPPVFVIPSAWPAFAMHLGQLDYWFRDVLWQAGRSTGGILPVTGYLFSIDPVMTVLGAASFVYAAIRKDPFLVFWFAPFLIFVSSVGFFQYFHYILLMPVACIAAAYMIHDNLQRIKSNALFTASRTAAVLGFVLFGVVISSMLINTDMSSAQFDALEDTILNFDDDKMTLLASPVYTWVLSDVHDMDNVFLDYADILYYTPATDYLYILVDPHYILDQKRGIELVDAYQNTELINEYTGNVNKYDTSKYPYTNLRFTNEGGTILVYTDMMRP